MLSQILLLALGFLLITKGGDLFVDSSVHIAKVLGVPRIVIGGTLVSLATTVPELTVSAMASWMGDPGIALGNAVGSAIANIGLIVGTVAVLCPVTVEVADFRRRSVWMVASAVFVVLFTWELHMLRAFAFFLLAVSFAYLFYDYFSIRQQRKRQASPPVPDDMPNKSLTKSFLYFTFGVVMVVIGSRLLVIAGIVLAKGIGIPSAIIGLSVIAVGTSLPELVTGITAARKGVPDLSIGNIVGANVLNLAMITGLAGVIHPLTLERFTQVYSYPWLFVFIFLMVVFIGKKGTIGRVEGLVLLAAYVVYLTGLYFIPMGAGA